MIKLRIFNRFLTLSVKAPEWLRLARE